MIRESTHVAELELMEEMYRFEVFSDASSDNDGEDWDFGDGRESSGAAAEKATKLRRELLNDESLRAAIRASNVSEVQRLLDGGDTTVDKILSNGWTPLLSACDYGAVGPVELLLNNGADPNRPVGTFSPLMALCCSRCESEDNLVKCAELVIEHGGVVNQHDRHRMTALMYASQQNRIKLVRLLVSQQSDVESQDVRGWTPLMFAAKNGNRKVMEVLLRAGSNPDIPSNDGETAHTLAEISGCAHILSSLSAESPLNTQDIGNVGLDANGFTRHTPLATNASKESHHYGDIETFLFGLQLGELVPLFREHQITFSVLLSMTDADLQQVGVAQVGTRKKIMDAILGIHKREWAMPRTGEIYGSGGVLSSAEAVVVISHLAKHVQYVRGTVQVLLASAEKNGDMFDPRLEQAQARQLLSEIRQAGSDVDALQADVKSLRDKIQLSYGSGEVGMQYSRARRIAVVLGVCVVLSGVGGLLVWHRSTWK